MSTDAIVILKEDHKEIRRLFRQFEKAGDDGLNPRNHCSRYFSDEFTEVKLVLRVVPMPLTAPRITMLRPTAIRQYSMAVAPD